MQTCGHICMVPQEAKQSHHEHETLEMDKMFPDQMVKAQWGTFWANASNVMWSQWFNDCRNKLHTHAVRAHRSTRALMKTSEFCGLIAHLCVCLSLPALLHKRAVGWGCISAGPPPSWWSRLPRHWKTYPWLLLNLYRMIRLGLHPRTQLSPSRDSAGSIAANA